MKIFKDLLLSPWWGWIGLGLFLIAGTVAFVACHTGFAKVLWSVVAFSGLTAWLAPVVLSAAKNGHKFVPTVCVWTGVWYFVGLATFFFWYFNLGTTVLGAGADRMLNIVPAVTAIVAAGLGWYVHYQFSARTQRINASFALVMEMMKSSEYIRHSENVAFHFPSSIPDVVSTYSDFFMPGSVKAMAEKERNAQADGNNLPDGGITDKQRAEAVVSLCYILNFYEFMAAGVRSNDLDSDMLFETVSEIVVGRYTRSKPYVDFVRSRKKTMNGEGQALAYEHLEVLASQWSRMVEDRILLKRRQKN